MSDFTGFVLAGAQIGFDTVLFRPKRGVYDIVLPDGSPMDDIIANAVIEETHIDELEITEHPVQQGAMITDHAFKRPAEVTLRLGWSNSALSANSVSNPLLGLANTVSGLQSAISGANVDQINAIYDSLLLLQESRALFTLYTGKRTYSNMICKLLSTTTDFKSEHSLPILMVCKQIIIVDAQTVAFSNDAQADPSVTGATTDLGQQSVTATKTDSVSARIKSILEE